jgi:hypothetical protein
MNILYFVIYFTCFALIAGSAFAMMWANINAVWRQPTVIKPTHPEAPAPGEEVLYVDFTRERLEKLLDEPER